MKRNQKSGEGFTLIELLVVVAIIGILAAIILSALGDARAKARDARRESDIKTIQNALEMYYLDNGKYPTTSWRGSHTVNWDSFQTLLGTTLPNDPLNSSTDPADSGATTGNYVYSYFGHNGSAYCSGQGYMLIYNKETSNGTGPSDGVQLCASSTYTYGDAFVVGMSPNQ